MSHTLATCSKTSQHRWGRDILIITMSTVTLSLRKRPSELPDELLRQARRCRALFSTSSLSISVRLSPAHGPLTLRHGTLLYPAHEFGVLASFSITSASITKHLSRTCELFPRAEDLRRCYPISQRRKLHSSRSGVKGAMDGESDVGIISTFTTRALPLDIPGRAKVFAIASMRGAASASRASTRKMSRTPR